MSKERIAKVLGGEASEEEIAALAEALDHDPALLASYLETAEMHAMLGVALEDELTRERYVQRIIRAAGDENSGVISPKARTRISARSWGLGGLAAAAALALIGFGWWYTVTGKITVMGERSITLEQGGNSIPTQLERGRRLKFSGGLVQLEIGNKGTMIVEGPAELELSGRSSAVLHRGKLMMHATPAGKGYTIHTPDGEVEDLGTEFGVSVGDDGKAEVHVLRGQVEARIKDQRKFVLNRSEGMRMAEGERIKSDDRKFYTALPPEPELGQGFVHWPMDEGKNFKAKARVTGMKPDQYDMTLLTMDQGNLPQWVKGKFGKGLAFDGKGAFLESGYKGTGGGTSRTLCFWVKVPRQFSQREGFSMVAWGRYRQNEDNRFWQIAVNSIKEDGPIGRLRVGTHGGFALSETDLRDDEWHHVAVVLYGGSRPEVGTQLIVYIDGRLESMSRASLGGARLNVDTADRGLRVGRNVTYVQSEAEHWHGGFFRGEMDELYLFETALSQKEILSLKDHNRLPEK